MQYVQNVYIAYSQTQILSNKNTVQVSIKT